MALAAEGADIVIADARRPMNLTYPLEPRMAFGARPRRSNRSAAAASSETVTTLGSLDIAVAHAGVVRTGPLDEVTDEIRQQLERRFCILSSEFDKRSLTKDPSV